MACMRKSFFVLFVSFLLLSSTTSYAATTEQTASNEELIGAGITPNSVFYGIDRFFEKISYFLTFSDEKRIEKLTRFSEERLAEINEIDADKNQESLDDLYDDYGTDINKANNILTKLIEKGKASEDKLQKMQGILEKATTKEELIKVKSKDKINQELKNRVQEIKVQVYLTVISDIMNEEENEQLKKYGNGVILKLKALAEITGLTMDEILNLDIYGPDDPTTEIVEKDLDFEKLEKVLDLDKEDLIDYLKDYHKNKVEEREAEKERQQGKKEDEEEDTEKGEKDEAEQRREEAQKRQEEIQKDMNERVKGNENESGR